MHPVLQDNLLDHEVCAETMTTDPSGKSTLSFVLSAMRIFKNFAVLVASGRIEFPVECAQALLTTTTSDMRELMPEFYRHQERVMRVLPLDLALDEVENFGDTILSYYEGDAVIKRFDADEGQSDAESEAYPPISTSENEAMIAYSCEKGGDSAVPSCGFSDESAVFSARTLQAVEDGLNKCYQDRYGEEPSIARQDFHCLHANILCGVALDINESEAYECLRQQVVEETVARVAKEKAAQRRQSFVSADAVANALINRQAEADRERYLKTVVEVNDMIGEWLLKSNNLKVLATLARRLAQGPADLRETIRDSGGIASVDYWEGTDTFDLLLEDGEVIQVIPQL